jgi:hypothetical protein
MRFALHMDRCLTCRPAKPPAQVAQFWRMDDKTKLSCIRQKSIFLKPQAGRAPTGCENSLARTHLETETY